MYNFLESPEEIALRRMQHGSYKDINTYLRGRFSGLQTNPYDQNHPYYGNIEQGKAYPGLNINENEQDPSNVLPHNKHFKHNEDLLNYLKSRAGSHYGNDGFFAQKLAQLQQEHGAVSTNSSFNKQEYNSLSHPFANQEAMGFYHGNLLGDTDYFLQQSKTPFYAPQYMNPYESEVLDSMDEDAERMMEAGLSKVDGQHIANGTFGSSANEKDRERLIARISSNLSRDKAGLRMHGFNKAREMHNAATAGNASIAELSSRIGGQYVGTLLKDYEQSAKIYKDNIENIRENAKLRGFLTAEEQKLLDDNTKMLLLIQENQRNTEERLIDEMYKRIDRSKGAYDSSMYRGMDAAQQYSNILKGTSVERPQVIGPEQKPQKKPKFWNRIGGTALNVLGQGLGGFGRQAGSNLADNWFGGGRNRSNSSDLFSTGGPVGYAGGGLVDNVFDYVKLNAPQMSTSFLAQLLGNLAEDYGSAIANNSSPEAFNAAMAASEQNRANRVLKEQKYKQKMMELVNRNMIEREKIDAKSRYFSDKLNARSLERKEDKEARKQEREQDQSIRKSERTEDKEERKADKAEKREDQKLVNAQRREKLYQDTKKDMLAKQANIFNTPADHNLASALAKQKLGYLPEEYTHEEKQAIIELSKKK